jgi:dipeptidyl aminopeptidase/acylaminoacyl peptidase
VLSPDGKHLAYVAWKGHDEAKHYEFAIVDGHSGPAYVNINGLLFSPDSQHLMYAVGNGSGVGFVVLDGTDGPRFDYVADPAFSPDSKHVVYTARTSTNDGVVVRDGKPGPAFFNIVTGNPPDDGVTFSPDSQHVAYIASRVLPGKHQEDILVLDDHIVGAAFELIEHPPVFSPDSQHVACAANAHIFLRGWKSLVCVDGNAGPEYDHIIGTVFSTDSKHVAYVATTGRTCFVVVDRQVGPQYDWIGIGPEGNVIFDSDGALVYLAIKNRTLYRVHQPVAN